VGLFVCAGRAGCVCEGGGYSHNINARPVFLTVWVGVGCGVLGRTGRGVEAALWPFKRLRGFLAGMYGGLASKFSNAPEWGCPVGAGRSFDIAPAVSFLRQSLPYLSLIISYNCNALG